MLDPRLHDTVEDNDDIRFEDLESIFGPDVRRIVEGETKASKRTALGGRGNWSRHYTSLPLVFTSFRLLFTPFYIFLLAVCLLFTRFSASFREVQQVLGQ